MIEDNRTPGGERQAIPPKVDFRNNAQKALAGGIFALDTEAMRLNIKNFRHAQRFPTTMLERTYGNGVMVIEKFEEDVPVQVMNMVRKNFVAANRLLLPNDQVLRYFHQRFYAQDVFTSASMRDSVDGYSIPARSTSADSTLSFQTEGVDRSSKKKTLFTQEEQQAGLKLAASHPEVVLTILGYQSVVQDYLQELGREFEQASLVPNSRVTAQNVEQYKEFIKLWNTPTFTRELVPAIALYYTRAKEVSPDIPEDKLFTQKLFHDAVNFVIANGGFRNYVTVPAHVASNRKKRTNHFLCPAVGTIREQLLDGAVLYRIYEITKRQRIAGNQDVIKQATIIQRRAERSIKEQGQDSLTIQTRNKTFPQIAGEAIAAALMKTRPITFTFEETSYTIPNTNLITRLALEQAQQPGDRVIICDYFYETLSSAVAQALFANVSVFFEFNNQNYRVIPDQIKALLSQVSA